MTSTASRNSAELRDLSTALVAVTSALDFGVVERSHRADLETHAGLATAARLLAEQLADRLGSA